MKSYSHGDTQRPYFEGWYLKHQTKDGPSLALIPALHIDSSGQPSASLQVISNHGSWWLNYPETAFHPSVTPFRLQLGENTFSHCGVTPLFDHTDPRASFEYSDLPKKIGG